MAAVVDIERAVLKMLPPGTLAWVVRNNQKHYQELIYDVCVFPEGILVILTVTRFVSVRTGRPRFRSYLSASHALLRVPKSVAELPEVHRNYLGRRNPPKKSTTLQLSSLPA